MIDIYYDAVTIIEQIIPYNKWYFFIILKERNYANEKWVPIDDNLHNKFADKFRKYQELKH